MPNSSRRRFLGISAGMAGRIAASGTVSLPILASMSKRATAVPTAVPQNHCFLGGTRILTPDGEIPIESLKIGGFVETLSGPLPIKWIGRQSFRKDSPSWHWSVAPVRVARSALGDRNPHRDLYLSPNHSLFMDGSLIPVQWLVNGKSITLAAMDDCEVIDYFNIELETHQVVFAEGTLAETLLIANDRESFVNFVEYERLYGSDERAPMQPFAPIVRYKGGRGEVERLLRLAISPVVDVRDASQRAHDRIAARAELADL